MRYALICLDKPNALQTRVENRAAHLAYIKASGVVEQAGPFIDAAGQMCGSAGGPRCRLARPRPRPGRRRSLCEGGAVPVGDDPGMEAGDRMNFGFSNRSPTSGAGTPGRQGGRGRGMARGPQLSGPQQHAGDEGGRPGVLLSLQHRQGGGGDRRGLPGKRARQHHGRPALGLRLDPGGAAFHDGRSRWRIARSCRGWRRWSWSTTPGFPCSRSARRNGKLSVRRGA
jgi:hypothetical protein